MNTGRHHIPSSAASLGDVAFPTGPAAIIARHRAELVSSARDISGFFPNGWAVRATSGGPRSSLRVEAEILHNDLRIMRVSVDAHGMQLIPTVSGLSLEQMDRIAGTLAKAIERHLEVKAERDLNPMPDDLGAAIAALDVVSPATRRICMAGKPQAVAKGAFTLGPADAESILHWMEEGDILVEQSLEPQDAETAILGWKVLREGKLVEIGEAEVRRLADAR